MEPLTKRKISAVIFDVGEVLLTGLWGVEHRLEPLLGIPAEKIFADKTAQWTMVQELFNGEMTEDEFVSRLLKETGWSITPSLLKEVIRENFQEVEGTKEIVQALHKKGFKLGLLSDHAREWVDHCHTKYNHHDLFHAMVYSFDVGVTKPNKKGFLTVLSKLGAKPEEAIFIDDSPVNIESARGLGIDAIRFFGGTELKIELGKRGIYL